MYFHLRLTQIQEQPLSRSTATANAPAQLLRINMEEFKETAKRLTTLELNGAMLTQGTPSVMTLDILRDSIKTGPIRPAQHQL